MIADQLRVVDVGNGVRKVRETVPDVLTGCRARLPKPRLKVSLRHLQTRHMHNGHGLVASYTRMQ